MDISSIANLATRLTQGRNAEETGVAVLKKALDAQRSSAQTLIASITPARSLPSHLGQNVNTVA